MLWGRKMKLNIGCGSNKIEGYINIDEEESVKPDLVLDILEKRLPYEDNSVEEILFFHCIEHVRKVYHDAILTEFYRVLQPDGKIYISYPNFIRCVQQWQRAVGRQKMFFENTIYGRQLYPADYHVAIMDPDELAERLGRCGFGKIVSKPEPKESYNFITFAQKCGTKVDQYEDLIAQDVKNTVIKEIK
jgi:SAM-dependent methyltransferase